MKNIIFLILILILTSCKKEKIDSLGKLRIIENQSIQFQDKNLTKPKIVSNKKLVDIGYADVFEKKLKLKFNLISKNEFKKI